MNTNTRRLIITLFILSLFSASKGEDSIADWNRNVVSIPTLSITDEYIIPLLDSACYYWENSNLNNVLSYATVVPYIDQDNCIIWKIQVEQLYDFDVFTINFPNCYRGFIRIFNPYGILHLNNHFFFVGVNITSSYKEDVDSRRIVESYFQPDTSYATFKRNIVEQEISKTNYLQQRDSIKSSSFFPELFVYDVFDAVVLDFIEFDKSFILLRKKIVKSPWQD